MRSWVNAATAVFVISLAGAPSEGAAPVDRHRLRWERSTGVSLAQAVVEDATGRPYLYAAIKEGGLLVLELTAAGGAAEVARISRSGLGGLDAMNLTQKGRMVYLALGSFFSGPPVKAALAAVDVSDPHRPRVTALWKSPRRLSGSAVVLAKKDLVFLGAMDRGVFIFRHDDTGDLELLSQVLPDVDFPRPDPNQVQHPNARGLAWRKNRLYVANDAGGLRVVDVSDPTAPREIGKYLNPRMPDKPSAYNNLVIDWPYAYVAVDYCGFEIINVRKPDRMRQMGWWNPWNCDELSNIWFNSAGHTNQIGLDRKGKRVFLSAGDSELQVIDVENPRKPRLVSRYGKAKNGQGAWGVGLGQDAIYLVYIRALIPFSGTWSGIRAVERLPIPKRLKVSDSSIADE